MPRTIAFSAANGGYLAPMNHPLFTTAFSRTCRRGFLQAGALGMRGMSLAGFLLVVTVISHAAALVRGESNWPGWRGPQQNGHTTETNVPIKWSSADVLWKTSLPGVGQSSPIIWGERIFL